MLSASGKTKITRAPAYLYGTVFALMLLILSVVLRTYGIPERNSFFFLSDEIEAAQVVYVKKKTLVMRARCIYLSGLYITQHKI